MFLTNQPMGHVVTLSRTDPRHLPGTPNRLGPGPAPGPSAASRQATFAGATPQPTESFREVFSRAFERVNDTQVRSAALGRQMITDPDSVDIHNLTVAMAEANMAISMTKAIVDRTVQAFRTITTLR